jgi:hypothetical protein
VALRGYSNLTCYYRYDLLSSRNFCGGVPMKDDSILPTQAMIHPDRCFTTQRESLSVVARPPSCRFFAETGGMGGKRPLGKAWSVANAPRQEGADVDIDLEANRAGGRETAGAGLYISSIREPGRGGLIPESTEFGSPGGSASNLSLLPPSGGRKPSLLALETEAYMSLMLLYFMEKP